MSETTDMDRFTLIRIDATAQARGVRPFVVRALAAAVALAALSVAYASTFGIRDTFARPFDPLRTVSLPEQAAFAEQFAMTVLFTQFGLVIVLVPALVSDCIARDRERGTLDLVLATDLSDHEIVVGRVLSRLLVPGCAALSLLPVLALTQLFGGVSMEKLVGGTLLNAATFVGVSGACGYFSCRCATAVDALASAFVAAGAYALFGGTLLGVWLSDRDPFGVINVFLLGVLAGPGVCGLRWGQRWLRSAGERTTPREAASEIAEPRPMPEVAVRTNPTPPIGDDPLLWKERHFGLVRPDSGTAVVVALGAAAITLLSCGYGALPFAGLIVFVRAGNTLVRERERDTLTALRLLPGGIDAVLRAKWLGALDFSLKVTAWLGVLLVAFVAFKGRLLTILYLVVVGGVDVMFFATAGLAISAATRTVKAANFALGVALAGMLGLPVVAGTALDIIDPAWNIGFRHTPYPFAASPLTAWMVPLSDGMTEEYVTQSLAAHFLVYGTATFLAWKLCRRWAANTSS